MKSLLLYYCYYYFLFSDGKTWWRQEASTPRHHLKNWKVSMFPGGQGVFHSEVWKKTNANEQ